MFVKQIDLQEALRLAAKGKEIKVLVPPAPGEGWNSLVPDTLQDMLEGCLFFRDEPAMVKPVFEAAVQEMEALPGTDGADAKIDGKGKKPTGKRRPVDTGKIMALHKAGWSTKKIADELGMNEKTVWYYIDKTRKAEQDAED